MQGLKSNPSLTFPLKSENSRSFITLTVVGVMNKRVCSPLYSSVTM